MSLWFLVLFLRFDFESDLRLLIVLLSMWVRCLLCFFSVVKVWCVEFWFIIVFGDCEMWCVLLKLEIFFLILLIVFCIVWLILSFLFCLRIFFVFLVVFWKSVLIFFCCCRYFDGLFRGDFLLSFFCWKELKWLKLGVVGCVVLFGDLSIVGVLLVYLVISVVLLLVLRWLCR